MACNQNSACTTDNTVTFADAKYAYDRGGVPVPATAVRGGCSGSNCSEVIPCCGDENATPDCTPKHCMQENAQVTYRLCCDPNGVCCCYDCRCRDPFWPHFAHPRWLCCKDLYSACEGNSSE